MFTTYRTGNVVFSLIASNIFCAAAELSNVSTTRTASGPITKPAFEPARSGLAAKLSIAGQAPDPRSRNEKGVGLWHAALKHREAHIAYATGTMEFFIDVLVVYESNRVPKMYSLAPRLIFKDDYTY